MASLDEHRGAPVPVSEFIDLATRIVGALAVVRDRNGYHGRLCPQHILVDPAEGSVRITGAAGDAPGATDGGADGPLADAALLPYIAPEATGHMNRPVDLRSDFYALGCIFHEMLSGSPPFAADDLLGWIHAHVARTPPPLASIALGVPRPLSDIVVKLLSKMADERYQSVGGLLHDLARCRAALGGAGPADPFPLGERDVPERFQMPSKLYGRDQESAALLRIFSRMVSTGQPALALVKGPSGIGKSSLVHELERSILRDRGAFAAGKFDEQRDIPYATIAQAFGQIARQILTESEARLGAFRERLLALLAPNGKLVTDLVPELALIIGEQPPAPPAPAQEAQNRLQKTFLDLVVALAQKDHPLVLFFDDMQWADAGSLALMQHVLASPATRSLLVVCAYRDGEVGEGHPFAATLAALEQASLTIHSVVPGPLTEDDVRELVVDAFRCDPEPAAPLAALVHTRTAGNPFFTAQLLASLCQEGLIHFDGAREAWRWDMQAVSAKAFSGDVLALLADKLRRLPERGQRVLSLAACIGTTFDSATVTVLAGLAEDENAAELRDLARAGLVEIGEGGARFVHDRVLQAAYALIPEAERAAMHLGVARAILASRGQADLFELVSQLERGASLIVDPAERLKAAELTLLATRKAMASAAYRAGARYAATGRRMLPPGAWDDHHELTYALHVEGATCANASGRFDEASALLTLALENARSAVDRVTVHRIRMDLRTNQGDFAGACSEAATCLAPFGITLTLHPTADAVSDACDRALGMLGDRSIESLLDLKEPADASMRAALAVLSTAYAPAHWVDMRLTHLVACWTVELSLRYGNADASVQGYAGFGTMLGPVYDRHREGARFGKLGYELAKRRGSAIYLTRACNLYGGMTSYWTEPFRAGLALAIEGLEAAMQAGDLTYASFHVMQIVCFMIQAGEPLADVWRELETQRVFARENQLPLAEPFLIAMRGFIASLLGKTRSLSTFDEEGAGEAAIEQQIAAMGPIFEHTYLGHKVMARTIARRHHEALAAAERARALSSMVAPLVYGPAIVFCTALCLAATCDEAPPDRRGAILEELRALAARIGVWAESGPANYASKHTLVLAELARLEGHDLEAMRLHDLAIELARENGLTNDEALACEAAARFFQSRGRGIIHRAYLLAARDAYARWGAVAKVAELDEEGASSDPQRSSMMPAPASVVPPSTVQRDAGEPKIDTLVVVKAVQAISGEIRTEGLLSSLLRIVIEHAGAERCDLLLLQREELLLAASAVSGHHGIAVSVKAPPESPSPWQVPLSVVGYVKRMREPLILDDAAAEGMFTTDEHVLRERTRSVLCMPILRQSTLVGVIYLENNLARGAFTKPRLWLVELLSAQAAISLENATLYEDVARERRRAEDALRDNLELVAQQEDAIRSLSTPIIEVWDGVLAMPLFGAIDERRAAQMMTVLLDAVVDRQCRYAVVDLTGVSTIDAATADHVLRLVRAVQLLGARGIVAGIGPKVAQRIVSLGVDLGGIETRANLREALVECMRAARAPAR
jgi:predicted ATPase/GAF domain-containing protein